ncbi:CarD family transcriptional regulator [Niallia endozanthoxylica]|uniref:CarD family transcriptional regulator n=1 Tax=Niallia endozanthoxylica TaxID=2036016 RepID=A0A5J5HXU9_9BACI|nr:CarD family transcriptional regulator [Niallia endozanthoxylica]KAA9026964.1 CarD family transcriptional regulator [Niallia endozanthoxylica]
MFEIGDVIVYSEHGLCQIDEICDQTISGITRTYYVLHPLTESTLKISTPVDNDKVIMLKPMDRDKAEELLKSFKQPGMDWIDDAKQRSMTYNRLVKTGNRQEIAQIANTLMRKDLELKLTNKRIYDQDRKLLHTIQKILFKEMALSLNTTFEEIVDKVTKMMRV